MSVPAVRFAAIITVAALFASSVRAQSVDLDRPPINYSKGVPENAVSALGERLAKREIKLAKHDELGYLPAVLEALDIPKSSQCLVFSKTSLQQRVISPKTPRALYFNDDVYVGYCQNGEVLEISAADVKLGTAFYTLYQEAAKPKLARQTDNCLQCHGSTATRGYPGHLVRSLKTDGSGYPHFSAGSFRTDTTSPFNERWGGWYVTGTHGDAKHLGNAFFTKEEADEAGPKDAGQNVVDLKKRFNTEHYLTEHSDIVALLVLEHQTDMHNRLAQASLDARMALEEQRTLNIEMGEKPDHEWASTKSRLDRAAEEVVDGLVFKGEPKLAAPVKGTSGFTEEFALRPPRDKADRSLRTFDLKTRLFRHPVSYLIYSASFRALPEPVRDRALVKLYDRLTAPKLSEEFASLAASDRKAILEIIRDTVPDLPECWSKDADSSR
jgi:hypothetical protein